MKPSRVKALLLGASTLILGGWTMLVYRPRAEDLAAAEAELLAEEASLRDARAAALRHGVDGLQAEIERLRAEAARREARTPTLEAESPEQAALRVREHLGQIARRLGVDAPRIQAISSGSHAGFRVDGFQVEASGGYHELGILLTETARMDRLVEVSEARLEAVPDSLLSRLPARGPAPAARSAAVAGRPLDARLSFTLRWYSLAPAADSTSSPEGTS